MDFGIIKLQSCVREKFMCFFKYYHSDEMSLVRQLHTHCAITALCMNFVGSAESRRAFSLISRPREVLIRTFLVMRKVCSSFLDDYKEPSVTNVSSGGAMADLESTKGGVVNIIYTCICVQLKRHLTLSIKIIGGCNPRNLPLERLDSIHDGGEHASRNLAVFFSWYNSGMSARARLKVQQAVV